MGEIFKCMATGVAAFVALALVLLLSYLLLPYSAYFWCALFFLGIATAFGSDIRNGRNRAP